jgi:hypothetical protein
VPEFPTWFKSSSWCYFIGFSANSGVKVFCQKLLTAKVAKKFRKVRRESQYLATDFGFLRVLRAVKGFHLQAYMNPAAAPKRKPLTAEFAENGRGVR